MPQHMLSGGPDGDSSVPVTQAAGRRIVNHLRKRRKEGEEARTRSRGSHVKSRQDVAISSAYNRT